MIYALRRVADELRPELEKYGIDVKPEENVILYRQHAIKLHDYTDSRKIRKILKDLIRDAKVRAKAAQQAKQRGLFDDETQNGTTASQDRQT